MQNRSTKPMPLDMIKWREIINNWSASGETQKNYCDRLGISLNTFSYARSKLQQQSKSEKRFVPLTIKSNEKENALSSSIVILENNRGYTLRFPASLPQEQLVKLFNLSGWIDA